MFTGIDTLMCLDAWNIVLPAVQMAARQNVTNKFAGVIVVLDPRKRFGPEIGFDPRGNPRLTEPTSCSDGRAIIFQQYAGEMDDETRLKYLDIAMAKAFVSWKTGLGSRVVQQEYPHLYEEGMTKWGGSVVRNGLVVAFSGVQAVFDEAIAGMMADWLIAMCRNEITRPDGVMASESSFIGEGDGR